MNLTTINRVQQYFKNKLLIGSFEPIEFNGTHTVVSINGYEFCIWNGELNPKYCKPWNSIGRSFMVLPEFTPDESELLYGHVQKFIAENAESIRIEKIAKLEDELNKLKS